ncbi:MAG: AmmeMemoRadiSam system protein A [Candidatus Methylomirabilia bacterium]
MKAEILSLARGAVEHHLRTGGFLSPPLGLPAELGVPGAAFVTLRIGEALRGCIGTVAATKPTLAEEIIANAVAAAVKDPRFPPMTTPELPSLSYEVDLLGSLDPVVEEHELDPAQYGVVVESGGRHGVLLPAIPEVVSTHQQITIARTKAGIRSDEPVTLYRFTVRRFREEA